MKIIKSFVHKGFRVELKRSQYEVYDPRFPEEPLLFSGNSCSEIKNKINDYREGKVIRF